MPGQYLSPAKRQQCRDLYHAGQKIVSIARELRISLSSAKRHAHATGSTANKPKSGRPRKLNVQQRRAVRRLANKGHTTVSLARHLAARHDVAVSRMTVGRVLKGGRKPLKYLPVIRGRRLSDVNQQKRMAFCVLFKGKGWQRMVFVDSKFLYVYKDPARGWLFKWQDPNNRVVVPQHPNPFVFHVYAAVGKDFKSSLVFVPPTRGEGVDDEMGKTTFKSQHFLVAIEQVQQQIEQHFSGRADYRVVLDHARQRTTNMSKGGLTMLELPVLEGFPPQSWDLNAIEVCWSWLDQNLRGHNPRTWAGWKRAIIQAWDEVQLSSINKLVERVPKQVDKIMEAGGK
jgi:transposase